MINDFHVFFCPFIVKSIVDFQCVEMVSKLYFVQFMINMIVLHVDSNIKLFTFLCDCLKYAIIVFDIWVDRILHI